MEKHNLEENIKIRSITGCLHKKSLVFHIAHNKIYLQYVVNHINAQTISLRLVIKFRLVQRMELGPNDDREDAPHFIIYKMYLYINYLLNLI